MLRFEVGGFYAAIALALRHGVPVNSLIDLGSADGNFSVTLRQMRRLAHAELLNIDAQAIYEPSLKRIQRVLGGHYRICAIAEQSGMLDLTTGSHPYWSSLRAPGDAYWQQLHDAHGARIAVPAHRLDDVVATTGLPAPHLIKLDIQGGERAALAGGERTLAATSIIVVETTVGDFSDIHGLVSAAGFTLFDLTAVQRGPDHSLSWFYPVYVHRQFAATAPHAYWPVDAAHQVLATQEERRRAMLRELDTLLGPLEAARASGKAPSGA